MRFSLADEPMPEHSLHAPVAHLRADAPPPAHYYADNLLVVVDTVLARYDDLLDEDERSFGEAVRTASAPAQRLFARLVGRKPLLREDRLDYAEVGDVGSALAELEALGLIERCPPVLSETLLPLLTVGEIRDVFWDVDAGPKAGKAAWIASVAGQVPAPLCRWRMRRRCAWLRLREPRRLALYQLLFFGDDRQDLTTFVMRDLGVVRFEAVALSRGTRQFADRAALDRYQELVAVREEITALGPRPPLATCRERAPPLLASLWTPLDNRLLERRRSAALNRLGRVLERTGDFDNALACYQRSTLPPARERRLRILFRLRDDQGVEQLRTELLKAPEAALEHDFAARFGRALRRPPLPTIEHPWRPDEALRNGEAVPRPARGSVEARALALLTANGGVGWHLENNLPLAIFALAYWQWIFAPVEGAFVNAFQTGPLDLFWPDFLESRRSVCADPLQGPLKPRLLATARAKAGVANRLFNWRIFTPAVASALIDAIPEAHLRALLDIVSADLAGRRSGFPDLTVVHAPGRYEFVEVKGPNDQLQIHQRLWIHALLERGLPVRVLRFREARRAGRKGAWSRSQGSGL